MGASIPTAKKNFCQVADFITAARVVQNGLASRPGRSDRLPAAARVIYTLVSPGVHSVILESSQEQPSFMPKRTFQPNRRHRSKTHGFRTRMKTKAGQAVISRRRAKGRKRVSVKPGFRE